MSARPSHASGRPPDEALYMRRMELWPRTGERGASALDAPQGLRDRGNRFRRTARVDANEIGLRSDRDAVIVEPHQPRGGAGDHVEASGEIGGPRDMADIGVE